ncbi:MAG TPA: hypothetical protein VFR76_13535 [Verrucomicrobiae bacterium]|nr:hypothetical protein [Verrucomicrobiae bacterium]
MIAPKPRILRKRFGNRWQGASFPGQRWSQALQIKQQEIVASVVAVSDLKQIPPIRTGKLAEVPERSARRAAMPALDLCRKRRTFREVKDDAKRIAIDADDTKSGMLVWRSRKLRGFRI